MSGCAVHTSPRRNRYSSLQCGLRQRAARGVGTRLIDVVAEFTRGCDALHIQAWVVDDNRSAIALYERNGFVSTGITQRYRNDESKLELLFERSAK
jgi:ribosomal protein S18 acetylase RimI-like enzyme